MNKHHQKTSSGGSHSAPFNYWALLRAVIISSFLGFLVYFLFTNSVTVDYSESRAKLFASFIDYPNPTSFSLNELDPINLDICADETTQEMLSGSKFTSIFNEPNLKYSYADLSKQVVFNIQKITPPRQAIIFLLVGMLVVGILLSRTRLGSRYKDLCVVYPVFFLLAVGTSWLVVNQLANKASSTSGIDFYKSTLLPAEKFYSLLTPWLYATSPIKDLNDSYIFTHCCPINFHENARAV